MRKLILTVGLLSIFLQSHAQWDFRTGYVVKNNKDSVAGFVRFNGAGDQKKCFFRPFSNAPIEQFSPEQIKAYGMLGGYRYVSVELGETGNEKRGKVFLTQIVSGRLSLFIFNNQYFVKQGNDFTILTRDRHSKNYYVDVLNRMLADCRLVANELAYEKTDLTNLIRNYNNCSGGESVDFRMRQPSYLVTYDLMASYDVSVLKASEPGFQISSSKAVSAGAGMNISFPNFNPQAFLVLELFYASKNFHADGLYKKNVKTFYEDQFINVKSLRLPIGIRYDLRGRASTPYLKIGLVGYLISSSEIRIVQDVVVNGQVSSSEFKSSLGGRNSIGLWGSIGYTVEMFKGYRGFAEARFEKSGFGLLPGSESDLEIITASVIVGVRF